MMHRQKIAQGSPVRDTPREPMVEGAVPLGKNGIRKWSSMTGAQLIWHAKGFMKEKGITGREQLKKADSGLYYALLRRRLLAKTGFEQKRRNYRHWSSMTDSQLIKHAKDFMKENGITGRGQLQKARGGLYHALQRRKLLAKVGFEQKYRDWSSMTDLQFVRHARGFMKENGITGRKQLEEADSGLYATLHKRKLISRVSFEKIRRACRDWSSMTDAQLIQHARGFMKGKDITGKEQLKKADSGLYYTLHKRNLLSSVFAGIEQSKKQSLESELVSGLRQAADAMQEFGGGRE